MPCGATDHGNIDVRVEFFQPHVARTRQGARTASMQIRKHVVEWILLLSAKIASEAIVDKAL